MSSLTSIPNECTAEEAAGLVTDLARSLGIDGDLPDVRTLRLWRTKRQITIEGRRFTRRNILEALVILKLRQDGLTQQNAVARVLALDEERLRLILVGSGKAPIVRMDAEPLITLQLLAKGVLEQHRRVSNGAIVGHTNKLKTGIENTPISLHQAMARLGRHYFEEGVEDQVSSVHILLHLCTKPLRNWAPRVIGELPDDGNAILIDPDYLVPSEECGTIAERAEGIHLSDLIEHYLHDDLRNTLKKLGDDADAAYTIIRMFIGEHPMVTAQELMLLNGNPELNIEAIHFVEGLYRPVHAKDAKNGFVHRCPHCKGLLDEDGLCILVGCRDDFPGRSKGDPVRSDQAYIARPEVLKYWADPAREELRLYKALRQMKALEPLVQLYPHSDQCDVSIGEEIGIDVKDYRDPVQLAQRLNRNLGGLGFYPTRILAIAERRWSQTYHDRLVEQFNPDNKRAIQVMSVTQAITHLKKSYGKGV